ncbi:glycosyltransferase family 2 protein [Loktanella sp. Alg231-35]|uniref:glycosyltransferase family 2 protein n=1 Tax=Loktanella sp. Alg231-35 TaxID=1922220 RepID=UPI000D557116
MRRTLKPRSADWVATASHTAHKPLIPLRGHPMIQVVIENLRPITPHQFHFLVLREHDETYGLANMLRGWAPGCSIIYIDAVTEGAACTVLLAREAINNDAPLMIANCDQYIDASIDEYLADIKDANGLIMTMWADDDKWSFVKRDNSGRVIEVIEKVVVSDEATVGIYNFARGADFVRSADAMIATNERVNGEFYVAPVYSRLATEGANIRCHSIGKVGAGMHGIGVPEDLNAFEASPISEKAVSNLRRLIQ